MVDKLQAWLQAATGPDRELDLAISMAVNYRGMFDKSDWKFTSEIAEIRSPTGGILCARQFVPYWTESIDAALGLVPEGYRLSILRETVLEGSHIPTGVFEAELMPHGSCMADDERWGQSSTPAIALCIAALKARGIE